jgi:predicted HTH domain antitoxin
MPLTIELPNDVESQLRENNPHFDREACETIALDLFRREKITIHQFRQMLGMNRDEADTFLIERGEYAQTLSLEELEQDFQTSRRIMKAQGR